MKSTNLFISVLLCVCLFSSCIEDLNIGHNAEKLLTVNCLLSGDVEIQTVYLCYSGQKGDSFYDSVSSADVRLFEDGKEVGTFSKKNYIQWQINYKPIPGRKYKLEVNVPGMSQVTAETTMPEAIDIVPAGYFDDNLKYYRQRSYKSPFWIFLMTKNTSDIDYRVPENISDDYCLSERIATNHPYVDDFNSEGFIIFSDIGGKGNYVQHNSYLRIGDNDYGGPLTFSIEGSQGNSIVVFRAVSDDYDKYLKSSFQKALCYQSFDDITAHFEENVVYGNITGGLGIFGAYYDKLILRNHFTDVPY